MAREYGHPVRTVRVPEEIWAPAVRKAEADGKTISQVTRHLLDTYAHGENTMSDICTYCSGPVIWNDQALRYEHATDGQRVQPSGPGDMASAAHNRAGTPVSTADVAERDTVLWICTDCTLAAEGYSAEEIGDESDCEPLGLLGDYGTGNLSAGGYVHGDDCPNFREWLGIECECERQTFSWASCDGCGSTLGGERNAYTLTWTTQR